jgi:hypothetical protein
VGDGSEQSIAARVAARCRHTRLVSGGESEVQVLQTQQRREPSLSVRFVDDDLSVHLVGWRGEQTFGQNVVEDLRLHTVLSHQRERLSHRFNSTTEDEVVRKLDGRRTLLFRTGLEGSASHHLKQRLATSDGLARSTGHDQQLSGGRSVGPAKNRRRHHVLLRLCMSSRQQLDRCDAVCAHH